MTFLPSVFFLAAGSIVSGGGDGDGEGEGDSEGEGDGGEGLWVGSSSLSPTVRNNVTRKNHESDKVSWT